mmetsp:Transcript_73045/g.129370  ORF Transcript_73045/g.129370 Transcript_73045/m.129370 type:complete len:229 (-) Transcript_73045:35-721(-)
MSAHLAIEARKSLTAAGSAFILLPSASFPLPSSSMCQRKLFIKITEPGAGSAHAASTSGPKQDESKVTGLPSFSSRIFATGAMENCSTTFPLGRPMWDARTTDFAPLSSTALMVGRAPSIRAVLVMIVGSFLSWGTLKSTRMKTRLSFTSTSSIFNLAPMVMSPMRVDNGVMGSCLPRGVSCAPRLNAAPGLKALCILRDCTGAQAKQAVTRRMVRMLQRCGQNLAMK